MSLLSLRESLQVNVPTPEPGRYTFFVDSVTKQLYSKNNAGAFNPVGGFVDTFVLYPANHSTSGSISLYTLDLTGRPLPSTGKQINIKLSAPNTFGSIQISIPGLGTYNFFKVGGVNFAAGELKAGQIISFIVDSGSAFYLSGFLQEGAISVADTAAMQALMASNSLSVGAVYQFAFATKYVLNGVVVTAPAENLQVRAISPNSVESRAVSLSYPLDIIEINIASTAPYSGKITRRVDPIKNLDAPFDWRNVRFRRGVDPTFPSIYTVSNPANSAFSTSFQDVYCFANSQTGGSCSNIKIEGATFQLSNPNVAPFVPWGVDNLNIVITGGSNIHIKNSHSITVGGLFGGPNTPAFLTAMVIENSWDCTFVACGSGYVSGSRQVYAAGNLSSTNENYSIAKFSIRNSSQITVLTTQAVNTVSMTEFDIENSTNTYLQATTGNPKKIKIINSESVWCTDCSQFELVDVDNSTFKSATDCIYQHSSSLTIVNSIGEKIESSRSLVSMSVSGAIINGLRDAYQFRDKACNIVSVTPGNPQTFLASIPSAAFVNGELIAVTNSIALLNQATAIAFDTDADNIPNTAAFPLVVGDFQRFYPNSLATVAGNFYLLFNNNKFYLVFSALNCPFRIDTNNTLFDGLNSNIARTVNYNAGAITISDSANYDFGHVGILRVSHVGSNNLLSQIIHQTGKYPSLRRELRNNNPGVILTLSHSVGANRIFLEGTLQRQLNNAFDAAAIEADGTQWRVLRTFTADEGSYSQRAAISLTAPQLRNLNSVPILSALAPGNNKMVKFLGGILVIRQGAIPFTFASNLSFKINNVPVSDLVPTAGPNGVDTLGNRVLVFEPVGGSFDLTALANNALQFTCDANSLAGDSTGTLIVNYRIIDLP